MRCLTYAERWAGMDRQARAEFLRQAGATVHAVRGGDAPTRFWAAAGEMDAESIMRVCVVHAGSATLYLNLASLAALRPAAQLT